VHGLRVLLHKVVHEDSQHVVDGGLNLLDAGDVVGADDYGVVGEPFGEDASPVVAE
jgi:hypothetical protein